MTRWRILPSLMLPLTQAEGTLLLSSLETLLRVAEDNDSFLDAALLRDILAKLEESMKRI